MDYDLLYLTHPDLLLGLLDGVALLQDGDSLVDERLSVFPTVNKTLSIQTQLLKMTKKDRGGRPRGDVTSEGLFSQR